MEVRVKTTNYTITPEVSRYLDSRIATLEKLLGSDTRIARCEVEIGRDAGRKHKSDYMWYAEIHIVLPGKRSVYARNTAVSVNAAVDDVKEEIERQVRTEKEARRSITKKAGAKMKRLTRLD